MTQSHSVNRLSLLAGLVISGVLVCGVPVFAHPKGQQVAPQKAAKTALSPQQRKEIRSLHKELEKLSKRPGHQMNRLELLCQLHKVYSSPGRLQAQWPYLSLFSKEYKALKPAQASGLLGQQMKRCAVEATYAKAMFMYRAFLALPLTDKRPRQQKAQVVRKIRTWGKVEKTLLAAVTFKHHPTSMCALVHIAKGKHHIAKAFLQMPTPSVPGLKTTAQMRQVYKRLIDRKFAQPLLNDALKRYDAALRFARQYKLHGPCLTQASSGQSAAKKLLSKP